MTAPRRGEPGPILTNQEVDDEPQFRIEHDPDAEPTRAPKEAPQLKVESLENMGSMLELDLSALDPNFVYRWVHRSNLKIARAKARGYRVVLADDEVVKNVVGDSPETSDGTFQVGDVILMKTPRDIHKGRRVANRKRADRRLKGPVRKFRENAREASTNYSESIEVITDKGD